MVVDHLYVIPILASLDTDGDKKLETQKTAKALFTRHGPKAKTAAIVQISDLWIGDKFTAEVMEVRGEPVPLGIDSPFTPVEKGDKSEKSEPNDLGTQPSEKKPTQLPPQPTPKQASVGLYLVFHSDGGGMVIDPESVANVICKVVPSSLHAGITKISLFACEVADRGEGDPIDSVIGLTPKQVPGRVTLIGGLKIMVSLLGHLASRHIRPMICGYDVPVFAGDGPQKRGKPSRGVKVYKDQAWVEATYDDEDIYGRKLVIYKDGRQSLSPIKSRTLAEPNYKKLHKKVLRVNDQGQIAEALAGWSSKD